MSSLDPLNQVTQRQLDRWVRKASKTESMSADRLAELRAHLVDATLELHQLGISESEAALVAISRVGPVEELASEYSKSDSGYVWTQRIFWMCIGFVAISVTDQVIDSLAMAANLVAYSTGAPSNFVTRAFSQGWGGTAIVLICWSFTFFTLWGLAKNARVVRWKPTARFFLGATVSVMLLATATKVGGQMWLAQQMAAGELGDMVLTQHYVSLATYIGLPVALVVFAFSIRARSQTAGSCEEVAL